VIGWISGAFGGVEQQRQPPQQQPPQAGAQKPAQKKKLSINGFWKKTPANKNVPGIAKMTRGAAYPLSRERPSKKEVNSGSYAGGDYTGSRPDDATSSSSVEPSATVSSSAPEPSRVPPTPTETKQDEEPAKPVKNVKLEKFRKWMDQQNMDMDALRKSSWSGIPNEVRGTCWQLLMSYLPANRARRQPTLDRRRQEYATYLKQYYYIDENQRSEGEQVILRQIKVDVPRTAPSQKWVQNERVQQSLERCLYVWALRHPASSYVQGINDLVTTFYLVFITDLTQLPITGDSNDIEAVVASMPEDQFNNIEADCFWSLSKLLDGIQDHYTFASPGIQRLVFKLEELIARIDEPLFLHLQEQGLKFIQFAFRWMNCLLMRELSLPFIVRLWDTYFAEDDNKGVKEFHVYVCAAFLMRFANELKGMEMENLVLFIQSLPTANWTMQDIEMLLSQAFVYKSLYHDSPHHLN